MTTSERIPPATITQPWARPGGGTDAETPDEGSDHVLLCRCGECYCALPLAQVIETMRPQPVQPLPALPSFVLGVAMIRGGVTPVVDCARLLQQSASGNARRFVTLKVDTRQLAFACDEVVGHRRLPVDTLRDLPPLLGGLSESVVSAITALDDRLLVLLTAARMVPDDLWSEITTMEPSQ